MDENTAFSLVRNHQKVGSVLVGAAERQMVSHQKKDFANASTDSNVDDNKRKIDHCSSSLMHQMSRRKIKEAARVANCRESASASSALENLRCHQNSKTLPEEHQSVQCSSSAIGNLGPPKLSLQNLYHVLSESDISVNCSTEVAGKTSKVSGSTNLQKEIEEKIISKNNSQQEETVRLKELSCTPAEKKPSNPQQPVLHNFSILAYEDKKGSTGRNHYSVCDSTNKLPSATYNFPMKGLKHIPILKNSIETITCSEDCASTKSSPFTSPSNSQKNSKKKKLIQRQLATNLQSDSPKPDLISKYCFNRHKVFADKVESRHQHSKISESTDIQNSETLGPWAPEMELSGNSRTNSSFNFGLCCARPIMYGNYDLERGKTCSATSNKINPTDSVEGQSNIQSIGLGLSSTTYTTGQLVSLKNSSRRMTSPESDWGKFLALSASSDPTAQGINVEKKMLTSFEDRLTKLQAFLKKCDQSDQYYSERLWQLSTADRSAIAVKLEKQAIMLSLEEVKEFNRMNTLKVFGKTSGDTTQDVGAASILKLLVPSCS